VKKLLILIVMLVVGMALFAVPIAGEPPGATIIMDTVEAVPHFEGAFAAVTDVSPVMQAESLCPFIIFEVFAIDNPYTVIAYSRQEVILFYGYSKTAKVFDNLRLAFDGWT